MNDWGRDIAYTARTLRRSPGFALAIVLTLALGLGTNAAILSFLDQVFLRAPAGVPSPDGVRRIWLEQPLSGSRPPAIANSLNYHAYRAIQASIGRDAPVALYAQQTNVAIGRDASSAATIAYATANYFSTLGVHPRMGRWFTDAEADIHGASNVAVVSDAFWRRHLGASPAALGTTLTVGARAFTIVGIVEPRFAGIDLQETEVWLPLGTFPTRDVARVSFWDSSVIFFSAFARVAPGANDVQLEQRATSAYRNAPVTDFAPSAAGQIFLRPILAARGPGVRPRELSIGLRLGFVALLTLLIAAANVVNLCMARAVSRRREVAVRLALGSSRARLVRLFMIESTLLALAAGLAALAATEVAGSLLRSQLLPDVHFAAGPLRWFVAVFTIGLALVTGAVTGAVTAAYGSRPDLNAALEGGIRGGGAIRSFLPATLVGVQAALSVVLLAGAALFVASLRNVESARIGLDADRVAYASITLPQGERPDTGAFAERMRDVGDRLRSTPGIEAIAFARDEPIGGSFGRVRLYSETDSSEGPDRAMPTASYVSADFFKAIGAAVTRGATFTDRAGVSSGSIVVNQTLARMFWPDRNPIGQCVHFQQRAEPCLTVVGVVEDVARQQILEEPAPQLYLPIFASVRGQRPPHVMIVRAEPRRLAAVMAAASNALHAAFARGEPSVVRMTDRLAPQYRPWRLAAALFGAFGALSLVVAALGIYSSVSYSVTRRMHEFGVRIALGATAGDVMQHVVKRGVAPAAIGTLGGAAITLATARLVSTLLYGINTSSPLLLIGVGATLMITALVAACIPGWRAGHADPVRALMAD